MTKKGTGSRKASHSTGHGFKSFGLESGHAEEVGGFFRPSRTTTLHHLLPRNLKSTRALRCATEGVVKQTQQDKMEKWLKCNEHIRSALPTT
jgi:hypothetical protein